jgi:asparagine synthase (glutamine-hydrolysing)
MTQFVELHSLFSGAEVDTLIVTPQVREVLSAPLDRATVLPPQAEEWSSLKRLMYYRLKHHLAEDMLVKVDRMSMACSLEIRTPFLDLDLAKLAMSLPDRHLIRNGEQKYLLRQIARKRLPAPVLDHPKTGFSIPLHRIQNSEYEELASQLLSQTSGPMELFSPLALDVLRETALKKKSDTADSSVFRLSHQLWSLVQLGAWGQRFGVSL